MSAAGKYKKGVKGYFTRPDGVHVRVEIVRQNPRGGSLCVALLEAVAGYTVGYRCNLQPYEFTHGEPPRVCT